jgi:hypothetical protein
MLSSPCGAPASGFSLDRRARPKARGFSGLARSAHDAGITGDQSRSTAVAAAQEGPANQRTPGEALWRSRSEDERRSGAAAWSLRCKERTSRCAVDAAPRSPSRNAVKISPMAATRQRWSEKEEHATRLLKFQFVVLRMRDSAREDRAGSLGSKPGDGDRRRHRRCVGMQVHEPRRGGLENRTCSGCPSSIGPEGNSTSIVMARETHIRRGVWLAARATRTAQQPGRTSFHLEEVRQRGEPVIRPRSVVRWHAHGTTREEEAHAFEVDRRQGRP